MITTPQNDDSEVFNVTAALTMVDLYRKLSPLLGNVLAAQLALSAHESLLRARIECSKGRRADDNELKAIVSLAIPNHGN